MVVISDFLSKKRLFCASAKKHRKVYVLFEITYTSSTKRNRAPNDYVNDYGICDVKASHD